MNAGKTVNCPQCGNTVAATDQFCPKCYARIEPPGLWRKFLSLFKSSDRPKPPRSVIEIRNAVTVKTVGEDGQAHEYHSLAEVPPKIRAEIERLESEVIKGKGESMSYTKHSPAEETTSGFVRRQSISEFRVKDASGNEKIYHSLDELPPEIRAAYERAQKEGH